MVITYYGKSCVKVGQGDVVIGFNPISKDSKEKYARFGADVALVSRKHPSFNGVENLSHGDTMPFVIDGPGEYEVGGIFIKGYGVEHNGVFNTIYIMRLDDMNICHLGGLSAEKLPADIIESLGEIDVLFVPVWNGDDILGPLDAHKIASSLEAKIIVPLHNGETKAGSALSVFLKEAGEESLVAEEKLTLKRKDLEGKDGDISLLSSTLN